MKHTKGTWKIKPSNYNSPPDHQNIAFHLDANEDIAAMDFGDFPDNEPEAVEMAKGNAELIALAPTAPHDCDLDCPGAVNKRKLEALPEMLEALEAAEQHYAMLCEVICTDNPPPGGHPVLLRLRAVIAKAKGE